MFGLFPHYKQSDAKDCGIASLRMIAKYYGKELSSQEIARHSYMTRNGVSLLDLSDTAKYYGFNAIGVKLSVDRLVQEQDLPCILHWNHTHFVVCYKIKKTQNRTLFYISDPASKRLVYTEEEFKNCWGVTDNKGVHTGIALLLHITPKFSEKREEIDASRVGSRFLWKYFLSYKKDLSLIILGMFAISMLQLLAPFFTQAMVDIGIKGHDLHLVTLILIAQMVLFVSQLVVSMIRSWVALYMNSRINISLISDFLCKLMRMPFRFFETKLLGDLTQRIRDNDRIEQFLTGSSIETLFSMINFLVFSAILAYYSLKILLIFLLGNTLYVAWTQIFMRWKRDLDLKRFNQLADEQDVIFQIIGGIREIKINNCETWKRWEWEKIQAQLFRTKTKTLSILQCQQMGSMFFSQTTNILISYIAAREVIVGNITLGMMMAITYIVGQIASPINNFIDFLSSLQYARISMERLNEIHSQTDEEQANADTLPQLPPLRNIMFRNVWFSYSGADRNYVLKNISLTIPEKKVTAIVGASGSGKTTILKLLLGYYDVNKGQIEVGGVALNKINPHAWRSIMGCVLQDGFIFSDDIAHNIALDGEFVDERQLAYAAEVANIADFVKSLPLGYKTKIGLDGNGISQGQKQRILIARAVYKNPEILLLDEATNALDAQNERVIMANLQKIYAGKTVVIAAHRLSTIRNADNIVVLADGEISEVGSHDELMALQGVYFNLIKNQLT